MGQSLKDKVLLRLRENINEFISGESLCHDFDLSRAAVWKAIKALQKEGYNIDAAAGKGYRLTHLPDILSQAELEAFCPKETNILFFEQADSTINVLRKSENPPEFTIAVADTQTAGRGRMGRSFACPPKTGLYVSWIYYPDCSPTELMPLSSFVCVAVCDAIEKLCGFRPSAKWPNDIIADGKKLCGILTEMTLEAETGLVGRVIVGIGINVTAVPEGLEDIAASLSSVTDNVPSRALLCGEISRRLNKLPDAIKNRRDWLDKYRRDCSTIGQDIKIIQFDNVRYGKALGIDDDACLQVRFDDGSEGIVNSGEVSVRSGNV